MEWKGGQVPISEPACGFDGSKCQIKFGELLSSDALDARTVYTIHAPMSLLWLCVCYFVLPVSPVAPVVQAPLVTFFLRSNDQRLHSAAQATTPDSATLIIRITL